MGLNSRELDILQTSIPKQHYYVISPLGRRLISLGIHNVALSFVGVNGREERQLVEDLHGGTARRRGRANGSEFAPERSRTNAWKAGPTITSKVQNEFERSFPCAKA